MTANKTEKKQLNEVRLSWAGKLFFAAVASKLASAGMAKLAGSMEEQAAPTDEELVASFPFKLQGTPEQISAVVAVIKSSKEYQEEIVRDGATVETVIQKLNLRNIAKEEFLAKTGLSWPL